VLRQPMPRDVDPRYSRAMHSHIQAMSHKATIAAAAMAGALLFVCATAGAAGFPGTYHWLPEHFSGPCITAHGGVHKGAKLDQYRCIGARNQKWYVELGPYHEAYTIHPSQSLGLCVDIPRGNYRKGAQPILWPCNGRDNQLLHISQCASRTRHCAIRPYAGGHRNRCLSVKGGRQANNTPLILWSCNNARDQRFTFR
jgi:hypothetical protein